MKKWMTKLASKRLIVMAVSSLLVPYMQSKYQWPPEVTWTVAGSIGLAILGETIRPSGTTGMMGNGGQ